MLDFYLDSPTCYVSTGLVVFHSYGTSVYIKSNICRCQMFFFFQTSKSFFIHAAQGEKKTAANTFPLFPLFLVLHFSQFKQQCLQYPPPLPQRWMSLSVRITCYSSFLSVKRQHSSSASPHRAPCCSSRMFSPRNVSYR